MNSHVVIALAGLALSGAALAGCTAAQVQTSMADGQLFCAVGQSVVAVQMVAPQGGVIPVLATGASSAYVKAACATLSGIAVSPPASPGAAPVVTIPSVVIPLKGVS